MEYKSICINYTYLETINNVQYFLKADKKIISSPTKMIEYITLNVTNIIRKLYYVLKYLLYGQNVI